MTPTRAAAEPRPMRGRRTRSPPRRRSARGPPPPRSARAASTARRETRRRAAGCTRTARRGGIRTSRSRRASSRTCRSSRRTPRGCPRARSRERRAAAALRPRRRGGPRARGIRCAMPPTTTERYAVVSCHVERPLDDAVWEAFARLQERPPGWSRRRGADATARRGGGRARRGALARTCARGRSIARPLGHHTHFTSPTHARPTGGDPGRTGAARGRLAPRPRPDADALLRRRLVHRPRRRGRVRGARVRRLHPTGDPARLPRGDAAWAELAAPAAIELGDGVVAAGRPDDARRGRPRARAGAAASYRRRVHAYFHDTDLLDAAGAR